MNNSINPFDNLYDVTTVNDYFGLDRITGARAKLEIIYWNYIITRLYERKHISELPSTIDALIAHRIHENGFGYRDIAHYLNSTHHDIKALEYTLRDRFKEQNIPYAYLLHFGLTSQDIVDPVYTIAIREFVKCELLLQLGKIESGLMHMIVSKLGHKEPFIARTHGQKAVLTSMHKEMSVYDYRIRAAIDDLISSNNKLKVKFGGAVGTLAVHNLIDQGVNWENDIAKMFDQQYHIGVHQLTTQVNGNDDKARVFSNLIIINNILIDFCQDVWQYFAFGYFRIKRDDDHVGSSTMAQKNNPIEFENIEGMLQLANSDLHFMMDKLTRSRMQRDLSDSVVQRFYGLMFAKCLHAYTKLGKAIRKLEFNAEFAKKEIEENKQVEAEMVQSLIKLKTGQDKFEEVKLLFNRQLNNEEFTKILHDHFPELVRSNDV